MRHINLHLLCFFNRGSYRSDHSLHRLNRSLNDPVDLRTSNRTVLDDHPRPTLHPSQCAPRLDQACQSRFVVRFHDDVHELKSDLTQQRHHPSAFPFSRRSPWDQGVQHSSCRLFSCHCLPSRRQWTWSPNVSRTCFPSSTDSRQSSSRPLPLMQCLHQLRNGKCVISCSILSCSLGRRSGSSRINSDVHDLLHVNCVRLLNLQSTCGYIQNVNLVAPIRRPICLLQTFALLSRSSRIFLNSSRRASVLGSAPFSVLGTPGGWYLLPLPRVPPQSQRSTLIRLLHHPLTQVVSNFFGCRRLSPRYQRLSIDTLPSCLWFDRTFSTVLGISQLFDCPEGPQLCPPDLPDPLFPATFIALPFPFGASLASVSAFSFTLAFPLQSPREMSHPAIVTCRSHSNLVHTFPILLLWLAATRVVLLHRYIHLFLSSSCLLGLVGRE